MRTDTRGLINGPAMRERERERVLCFYYPIHVFEKKNSNSFLEKNKNTIIKKTVSDN